MAKAPCPIRTIRTQVVMDCLQQNFEGKAFTIKDVLAAMPDTIQKWQESGEVKNLNSEVSALLKKLNIPVTGKKSSETKSRDLNLYQFTGTLKMPVPAAEK